MADFHWVDADDFLAERFRGDALGYSAWREFVVALEQVPDFPQAEPDPRILAAFDAFMQRVDGIPTPSALRVFVSAIIEMALLNSTHLISVQTAEAQGSLWVPYEYGRAKKRLLSSEVASWFDNQVYENTRADYLKIAHCAVSEAAVDAWLASEWTRRGRGSPAPVRSWSRRPTHPLPN